MDRTWGRRIDIVILLWLQRPWVFAGLVAMVTCATPSQLYAETIAGVGVAPFNGDTTPIYLDATVKSWLDNDYLYYLGFAPPEASDSFVGDATPGFAVGSARAVARETGLGVRATAESTFTIPNYETMSWGTAYVKDTLYGIGYTLATYETPGFRLVVTTSLDGRIKIVGDARVEVGVVLRITDPVVGDQYTQVVTSVNDSNGEYLYGNATKKADAPIGAVYGGDLVYSVRGPWTVYADVDAYTLATGMIFEALLYVRAQVGINALYGKAEANFYNTLSVTNIQLIDGNDQVLSDFQFTGSNGYVYPYNVPEPASLNLLALGGLILWGRTRRHSGLLKSKIAPNAV